VLALTLKDDTTNNKRTENERQNTNAQSRHNTAHLLLPQHNCIKSNFICF
jgi:hypothetical protein